MAISRLWFLSVAVAAVGACSSEGGSETTAGSGGAGVSTGMDAGAGTGVGTSTGTGGAGPNPGCEVPSVISAVTNIEITPAAPTTADAPVFTVTDANTGHTNVALTVCTPEGLVTPAFGGVDSGQAPFAWHWVGAPLPAGEAQVIFRADPDNTVYRTEHIFVIESGGGGAGGGGPSIGLCDNPAGNLIAHGTFEEGMAGLAPTGWQVRDPAAPNGTCLMSGAPEAHVFLSPSAPSCGGSAVTVDALGQWDCYAIQQFSDYNTIQGGATYRISAVARSQGNAVNPAAYFILGAQWLDANDAVFGDVKNPKPATASLNDFDWQVVSFDTVAPASAKRAVIWLSAHYPGRVDYDNVSIVKIAP